jgi:hypothetical protein
MPGRSARQKGYHLSSSDGSDQRADAEDVEDAAEVIGKRGQAELAADIAEASHQKSALVHPLLDRTERVLDGFAAPVEKLGPRL